MAVQTSFSWKRLLIKDIKETDQTQGYEYPNYLTNPSPLRERDDPLGQAAL